MNVQSLLLCAAVSFALQDDREIDTPMTTPFRRTMQSMLASCKKVHALLPALHIATGELMVPICHVQKELPPDNDR